MRDRKGQEIAALGQAIGTSAAQGFRLSEVMQRDFDNAKFQEASARYAELLSNTEAEFDLLQGEDAVKAFDVMKRKLDVKRNELERNLTSERQRAAFGRDAGVRTTVTLNRMNARRADQLRTQRIASTTASLDRAMRDRVNAAVKGDTVDFIRQSMVMHSKLNTLAELNSLPEEARTLAMEKAEDAVTVAAVEGMLDIGAVARARDFFESADGRIQDPQQRAALESRLKTAGIKQRADLLLDGVRSQGDLIKQRRFIRDMDEPQEVKDELLRRARQFAAEDRAELAYQRAELLGEAKERAIRGEPWDEKFESRLRAAGIVEQARASARNTTTEQGEYLMETLTDEQLNLYQTAESLYESFAEHLSVGDMRHLQARWQRVLNDKLREELAVAEQNGTSRGKRSTYAGTTDEAKANLDLEDWIKQQLTDIYPAWRGVDFGGRNMTREQARRFRSIKNEVLLRVNTLARAAGTKPTNEIIMQATRDVVKVRTSEGRVAAGLLPEELADATLKFKFDTPEGAQWRSINVARRGIPGFDPEASAKRQYEGARLSLVQRAIVGTGRHLGYTIEPERAAVLASGNYPEDAPPTPEEMSAMRLADGLVAPRDVFEALAYRELRDEQIAGEVSDVLDVGLPLTEEQIERAGPLQREINTANNFVRSQWRTQLGPLLEQTPIEIDRDDVAFLVFWPQFNRTFGPQLKEAYGSRFSRDDDGFRREVIDLLFPNASNDQKLLLWQHSAEPVNGQTRMSNYAGLRFGRPPSNLQGYLDAATTEMELYSEGAGPVTPEGR